MPETTTNELMEMKKLIVNLAAYYEKDLSAVQIGMYADQLYRLMSLGDLIVAIKRYCDDPNNEFFPRPISKLAGFIQPKTDDDADAKEAAGRIIAAVPKFGWNNELLAKTSIGPLGWKVVELQGGWRAVCEVMNDRNITSLQAQYRDLAKAEIKRARLGHIDNAPGLPSPDRSALESGRGLEVVQQLSKVKSLEEPKK